jgi:hypothetical protein
MGQLIYAESFTLPIEDRPLRHLQLVVFAKLRQQQSFAFSWDGGADGAPSRGSVWITPGVPVRFQFSGGSDPAVNQAWLRKLLDAANSAQGLRLLPEPPNEEKRSP